MSSTGELEAKADEPLSPNRPSTPAKESVDDMASSLGYNHSGSRPGTGATTGTTTGSRPTTALTDASGEEHQEDEQSEMKAPGGASFTGTGGSLNAASAAASDLSFKGTKSPMHISLQNTIRTSQLLTPIHAEVKNLSYWYDSRKKLGPKKHGTLICRQTQSGKWESSIWKLKPRDEDFVIVPTKVSLNNSHKSKWAAFRNCEKECKIRDSNPADDNPDYPPDRILETHFHLTIISTKFDRLTPTERLSLVYEALLEGSGQQLEPTSTTLPTNDIQETNTILLDAFKNNEKNLHPWELSNVNYHRYPKIGPRINDKCLGSCPPTNMKIGSIYGSNMMNLEIFRILLPIQKLTLIIEAKTPSQWKPEEFIAPVSERYGRTHIESNASHVPKSLQKAKQTERIKLLSHVPKASDRFDSPTKRSNGGKSSVNSLTEALGLDASVSGITFGKKVGGIYGHFFSDLPSSIKEMLIKKYKENKMLIQHEGNKNYIEEGKKKKKIKKKDENVPVTGMSKLRDKMLSQIGQADPDVGTQTEADMMEEVYVGARKMERAVIRMQRIRRASVLSKSAKIIWWKKYATITIQRIFRGQIAHKYVELLRKLQPVGAIRIQRLFRILKTKRIIAVWRQLSYRLTRWILPKIKRFLRNCFLQNIAKFYDKAINIQKIIRMFLAKNRYRKFLSQRKLFPLDWRQFYHDKVTLIQKILRGNRGRKRFFTFIEACLIQRVDIPNSIKIQKRYRGVLGRRRAAIKKYESECLALLQRVCRAFVRKIWDAQMAQAKLEIDSATKIQRIARGRSDRVLVKYIAVEYHYKYKYIPAVIKVQSQVRAWLARKFVHRMILEIKSAKICVNFWRGVLARREMMKLWREARERYIFNCAAQIQKMIRCYLSWKKYPTLNQIQKGRVLYAAKIIMRAWVTYVQSKRLQLLLDDNRQSFYKAKLPKFESSRKEIQEDRIEILSDIKGALALKERYKKRLKTLDSFKVQAQLRMSHIDKELRNLTPDDFERGWGESFGEEYEVLIRQQKMSDEEKRLIRARLISCAKELTMLYCELEDVEIELDHIGTLEVSAYEGMRRAAVGRIERRVLDAKERLIRMERCKWKTEAVRLHVIQRNREGYRRIQEAAKFGRNMEYARTVSYEIRQQRRDYENLREAEMHKQDGLDASALATTYESYAKPVQRTFDSIVQGNMNLLRNLTLEERAARIKKQYSDRDLAKRHKNGGQFSVLKKHEYIHKR
jgi:hypothetical protein